MRGGDVGGDGPGSIAGSYARNLPNPRCIPESADADRLLRD